MVFSMGKNGLAIRLTLDRELLGAVILALVDGSLDSLTKILIIFKKRRGKSDMKYMSRCFVDGDAAKLHFLFCHGLLQLFNWFSLETGVHSQHPFECGWQFSSSPPVQEQHGWALNYGRVTSSTVAAEPSLRTKCWYLNMLLAIKCPNEPWRKLTGTLLGQSLGM